MKNFYTPKEIQDELSISKQTFYNYIKYGYLGKGLKRPGSNNVWYTNDEFEDLKKKLAEMNKLKNKN